MTAKTYTEWTCDFCGDVRIETHGWATVQYVSTGICQHACPMCLTLLWKRRKCPHGKTGSEFCKPCDDGTLTDAESAP